MRELVDINTVRTDSELPKSERILEYVRQIKNPYRYKSGKFTVTAVFPPSGATLEDCLQGIMA
jgi:hypothetical protein